MTDLEWSLHVLALFTTQAAVDFSDFHTMDRVCCVLLEKLDKSVSIGSPRFHHSKESLSNLR